MSSQNRVIIQHLFYHKMHLQRSKIFSTLQATKKKFTVDVQSSTYPAPSTISIHLKFGRSPLPPFFGRHICMIPMFMQTFTFTPRYTVPPREEVLTWKVHLTLPLKHTKAKKDQTLGKDTKNYQIDYSVTKTFEQKPIKIDHFNDEEEKEVKGRVEKRKLKRREWLKKNKLLKKKGQEKWATWERNVGQAKSAQ